MKTVKIRFNSEASIIRNLGKAHLHRMREELIGTFKAAHPDLAIRRVDETGLEIEKADGLHPVFLIAEGLEAASGIPADVCVDYRGLDDDDHDEGDGYWSDVAAYRNLYN